VASTRDLSVSIKEGAELGKKEYSIETTFNLGPFHASFRDLPTLTDTVIETPNEVIRIKHHNFDSLMDVEVTTKLVPVGVEGRVKSKMKREEFEIEKEVEKSNSHFFLLFAFILMLVVGLLLKKY